MTTALTTTNTGSAIMAAGQVANGYAASNSFEDYTSRKAENTKRAQLADFKLWSEYLCAATNGAACPDPETLQSDPESWRGVTWGLVAGFVKWMLAAGYAVGTVNRHLATVRKYCKLASQAGVIAPDDLAMIRTVSGYGGKEAKRIDERRETTRVGNKKAKNVTIDSDQATALKAHPDTPQGRRDAVIMALLLDHGLRVGEIVLLQVTDFDVKRGTFSFYRPKVDKVQTHRMTADTARAIASWLATDAPALGSLLRGSRKGGALAGDMSDRAVTARVRALGKAVGLAGLSAHDCRHYWATRAARMGTDPFALRDAGGWSSMAMPDRYVEAAAIANERVKL